jgi:hypothetical protein
MADDWESALRKLTRKPPSSEVMQTIIMAMQGAADDRSVALLSAAITEGAIISAIVYVLRPDVATRKLLFLEGGPFSDFDKRIIGSCAVRLIGHKTAANLKVIRAVRNVFAHCMSDVRFDAPEIERACNRLIVTSNAALFIDKEPIRKSRYRVCYACDEIFRELLNYVGTAMWITGQTGTLPDHPILP